jgi:hypothetical protein
MAKLIVDGYEQLHVFGNKMLQISERKVRKMVSDGEIDVNVQIPYEYGKTISVSDFIQDFNEQNKDTLTVSKEFKKEVTPVLTRVLQKRGAGVTDEQYLGYLFGKDILVKGVIVSQIRGTMNDMFDVMKEYTQALKENGVTAEGVPVNRTPPPPPPPPPSESPNTSSKPQRRTPPPTQSVVSDESDFNFSMNEVVVDSSVQRHIIPESGKQRLMERKKRDKEISDAMKRAESITEGGEKRLSYKDAIAKSKTGKRGRKTTDYIAEVDEEQIAEAIILNESKPIDKNKIEGLD